MNNGLQKTECRCYFCKKITQCPVVYKDGVGNIIRCSSCGALFRPQEEHKEFITTEEYYKESIRCEAGSRLFFKLTFENLIEMFPQIKNGNLLDFGCGVGNFLLEAGQLGFRAIGIDSSPYAIEYCRKRGLEAIPSLEGLVDRKIKFDFINLNHVLEHINDPVELLKRLTRFLKENGILRIEVPNCGKFSVWKFIAGCKDISFRPCAADHLYFYSIATLGNVIKRSALEIIDMRTEGFGDNIRHRATRLNPGLFPRVLSAFLYFSRIEKIFGLESFTVALARKRLTSN